MGATTKNRIAVVTGAGRGLGREVALRLAHEGSKVALVARSSEQVNEAAAAIVQGGGTAIAIAADISISVGSQLVKTKIESEFGPPNILINAAGIFGPLQCIADSDPQRWLETLAINIAGPYRMCQAFTTGMVAQGWGRIINYSSAAAFHPPGPLVSAYATSKVALNQLTRHLASELKGSGVTANVLHPGDVKTSMWADIRQEAAQLGEEGEGYRAWVRWVDDTGGDPPAKAADLVSRLTEDAASDVTGQFLWIEDGLQAPIASWDAPEDGRPWKG